jgi:flavin reductase (DIM6/NTAB) family NADH-FMN oxidoreductase RutF
VSAPAIAEAPARLECVVRQVIELGEPGVPFGEVHLVIAEVVWVQYDATIAGAPGRIDPLALAPVGRLGLRSFVRTVPDSVLELPRVAWDDHVAGTQGR